jgi:Ca-activated chloride channel family protein
MYFTFTDPKYLFLLLAIPLIIFVYLLSLKNTKKKALKFANFDAIAKVKGVSFFSRNIVTTGISILVVTLLTLSASGMVLHMQAYASSFSFVIAIDVSRSMEAKDLYPNRLDAAKNTAKAFIDSSPITTRFGVVSFSGNARIHQDVTSKKGLAKDSIDGIEISSIEGTDIYEVVITSTNLLKGEDGGSIILMSDGQMNVGEVDDAVDYANRHDIIINTIGIGTPEGGKTKYGTSRLNEEVLKALAYNTEGEFYPAYDTNSLSNSMEDILKLSQKKISVDLSGYLLFAAILLFFGDYILVNMRYRILPF